MPAERVTASHRGCVITPDMVGSPEDLGDLVMAGFIEGEERRGRLLLPDCLDDYVDKDNLVRVVDVFVDELDLTTLGFAGPAATGRPRYSPATMLKLYLYGYLNRVQSRRSHRLPAGRPLRGQSRAAQSRHAALGSDPVLGQGHQGRLRQH